MSKTAGTSSNPSDFAPSHADNLKNLENKPLGLFFSDGKSKIDFVLVYHTDQEHTQSLQKYLNNLKVQGLKLELNEGQYAKEFKFVKIHAPDQLLTTYANIFKVELSCNNPYHKGENRIWFSPFGNEVTRPNPNSRNYQRAPQTFSQDRPTAITSAERSMIVFKLLKIVKFGDGSDDIGVLKLIENRIFTCGYPLHDGHWAWTRQGPLNDRQILAKFWGNTRIYKNQPLNLIEKYYGSEIAFYIASLSFQNRCLMVPCFLGILSCLVGIIQLQSDIPAIQKGICESNILFCAQCENINCDFSWLKSSCHMAKVAYVMDNPATIWYAIFMSLWGAVYLKLWRRKEAMLRLRWNLMGAKNRRPMSTEFMENAPRTRISSITGEIEYFVPKTTKILFYTLSYTIVFILVMTHILPFSVMWFRLYMHTFTNTLDENKQSQYVTLEISMDHILQSLVVVLALAGDYVYVPLFARIVGHLTKLRMPRSRPQFAKMYTNKLFLIQFAIKFTPLIYLAFFQGKFYEYPGADDKDSPEFIKLFKYDVCKPFGCFFDLTILMFTFLVFVDNIDVLLRFILCSLGVKKYVRKYKVKNLDQLEEWERSWFLNDFDKNFNLSDLYITMLLQYGTLMFFMSSSPLAPLMIMLNNFIQIHATAIELTKYYRRPVAKRLIDIGHWNKLMWAMTLLGIIFNAVSVIFSSETISRFVSLARGFSHEEYLNRTFSRFDVNSTYDDVPVSACYYRGSRYPPGHEREFQLTEDNWYDLLIKALFFIIFENVCLLSFLFMTYIIPEVPRKIKVKLEYDEERLRRQQDKLVTI